MGMGAAIGAGFFLSSGSAIHEAGPGLLLAYLLAGTVMYLIMRALGELALTYPSAGSFTTYATKFLGLLAGFIMGWSYWLGAPLLAITPRKRWSSISMHPTAGISPLQSLPEDSSRAS